MLFVQLLAHEIRVILFYLAFILLIQCFSYPQIVEIIFHYHICFTQLLTKSHNERECLNGFAPKHCFGEYLYTESEMFWHLVVLMTLM